MNLSERLDQLVLPVAEAMFGEGPVQLRDTPRNVQVMWTRRARKAIAAVDGQGCAFRCVGTLKCPGYLFRIGRRFECDACGFTVEGLQ